jgi:hypothetical protein
MGVAKKAARDWTTRDHRKQETGKWTQAGKDTHTGFLYQ